MSAMFMSAMFMSMFMYTSIVSSSHGSSCRKLDIGALVEIFQ